jgi:hypothetical protein
MSVLLGFGYWEAKSDEWEKKTIETNVFLKKARQVTGLRSSLRSGGKRGEVREKGPAQPQVAHDLNQGATETPKNEP